MNLAPKSQLFLSINWGILPIKKVFLSLSNRNQRHRWSVSNTIEVDKHYIF